MKTKKLSSSKWDTSKLPALFGKRERERKFLIDPKGKNEDENRFRQSKEWDTKKNEKERKEAEREKRQKERAANDRGYLLKYVSFIISIEMDSERKKKRKRANECHKKIRWNSKRKSWGRIQNVWKKFPKSEKMSGKTPKIQPK